ncbi:MAG: endolytic transglycosylase MltG [Coriobacteriales bacterium]|nr:endolytic transglycosylase MltG [Coriobacteriales bacterium]
MSARNPSRRKSRRRATPRHAAPKRRRGMPGWAVALIVVIVLAGLGVGGFFLARHIIHPYEGARVEDGQQVTVVIPDGSSGSDIIQILLDAGVIHSSKDFRKAAQEQNADTSLKCGTYTFVTGMDPADVVRQLAAGSTSSEGKLQIPEGLTVTQVAKVVEESLGIPQKDFLAQAKASNYTNEYPFLKEAQNDSLEGFLYPKTYEFSGQEPTADRVIRLMLTQYANEMHSYDTEAVRAELARRYPNVTLTDYDLLKIASIIEEEAVTEEDRPLVSSVFYNRLNSGMMLQSDATMGYVTNGAATAEDLKKESPYNTYLNKGLPPTPICSPSSWALEAAMNPAESDYLFFFIIDNEKYQNHTFTKTYEEHDEAYAKALEEQAAANEKE